MKFRNKFISKRIGTKTLASLLAFGMALGSPMAVFADDGERPLWQRIQCRQKRQMDRKYL